MAGTAELLKDKYQQALDEELQGAFVGQEGLLYKMLLYQLGWTDDQGVPMSGSSGERLHPVLCLSSCEALSDQFQTALPAAAAVELAHQYSLIHEDVQSGTPTRDDRPSVWWVWGPGQAINAGDGMHAMARLALLRLQEQNFASGKLLEAMRLFDRSCLKMCEGQHLDLAFQERLDVDEAGYLKMAEGKTGALMSCAMGLGALVASGEEVVIEAFVECGRKLGVAYQIRCDLAELASTSGGESAPPNVLNKKKLLPVVHALSTGDVKLKRELGTIYFKRVLEPQDVQELLGFLDRTSSLDYAAGKAEELHTAAIRALDKVDLRPQGRADLEAVCKEISTKEG